MFSLNYHHNVLLYLPSQCAILDFNFLEGWVRDTLLEKHETMYQCEKDNPRTAPSRHAHMVKYIMCSGYRYISLVRVTTMSTALESLIVLALLVIAYTYVCYTT
jgi:hypothetical protein